MRYPRLATLSLAALMPLAALAACTGERGELARPEPAATTTTTTPSSSTVAPTTEPATTEPPTTEPTTTEPATTQPATTAEPTTTSAPTTTTQVATTTTAAAAPTTAPAPVCTLTIKPGDSLSAIAAFINNPAVTVDALQLENAIANANAIDVGQVIDICVANGIDDRTGQPWVPPPLPPPTAAPSVPPAGASGFAAQQEKLNELLTPFGFPAMSVDGDVGSVTRRGLCAARVALGLSVSRDEMQPGSDEERILMATSSLPVPGDAPGTNRWILIDETCQVLFAGEGGGTIRYVFPTSTGQDEFPTRNGRGFRVFRYDPAIANAGWHDSTDFPASGDNPLNGNMYKPLYFEGGQAIHGANNVPTSPQSHGCARVRPGHQDQIVNWLGLSDVTRELWDPGDIGLRVTVQGEY